MKRHIITGLVVAALLILLVGLWLRLRTPPTARETSLAVSFVAFTNTPTGPAAVFFLTNGTGRSLHFQIKSVEHKAGAEWVSAVPKPNQGLVGVLGPGIGFGWPVPVRSTNTTWRIRLSCQEKKRGVARAVDRASELINKVKTGASADIFGGRMYEVVSSESE